ncbi:MAG: hypothetical protein KatS3mg110_3188 [Pirellulaceae bacterium]|nr:MAG: hypothetical protein KatS3mg110_3188 [Pirellulaceae bacterium]
MPVRLPYNGVKIGWLPGIFPHGVVLAALIGSVAGAADLPLSLGGGISAGNLVTFDLPSLVAFDPSLAPTNTSMDESEACFEIGLPISVLRQSKGISLEELHIQIAFAQPGIEVVDYLPRTSVESAVAGRIRVEKRQDRATTVGVSADGALDRMVRGNASAGVNEKDGVTLQYELLPPVDVAVVAGTLARRSAVYFKFRPAVYGVLEGERQLVLVVRAPKQWRAGYLLVTCRAEGTRPGVPALEEPRWATQQTFLVGLFLRQDAEARQAAWQFLEAERQLRAAAATWDKHSSHWLNRLSQSLGITHSPIPNDWWQRLTVLPPNSSAPDFVAQLPPRVRQAAETYLVAKRRLAELASDGLTR